MHDQIVGCKALQNPDRWGSPRGLGDRPHDGAPRGVSLNVKNATVAMRGLVTEAQAAFQILVEGHAIAQKILDALPRFLRHEQRDLFVDDAGAGADRVFGVVFRCVALGERRCQASLGPKAGGAFTEAGGRDHRDRERCKFQRGKQTGQAGPHHDDAVAVVVRVHLLFAGLGHESHTPKRHALISG